MEASTWRYYIPWQSDMDLALKQLHEDVFRRNAYERPLIEPEFLDDIGLFDADEQEREEILERYGLTALRPLIVTHGLDGLKPALEQLENAAQLHSMEELKALMCLSTEGTHSILDVGHIASGPGKWGLFPLNEAQIQAVYGTPHPTREQIEAFGAVDGLYGRNEGFYFTLYRNGEPDSIYIEGCSGD